MVDLHVSGSIPREERDEALSLVLSSRTFARAEQLRSLLRYLCEAEASGRHDLTEYAIGREALGRAEDYSTLADSSVRTRVYELRQKLDRFYRSEGNQAHLRIVIPKGCYLPQYEHTGNVQDQRILEHPAVQGQGPEPGQTNLPSRPWPRVAIAVTALLLVGGAGYFAGRGSPSVVDPVVREAWGPLAAADVNVLLCVATPLHLTVVPEAHQRKPSYPAPEEAYSLWRQHRLLPRDAKLGLAFTDNVIGFGTMNSVLSTARSLEQMGVGFQILPERVAPISTFRNRNVVVFGAPVDSEAVTLLHEHTPLVVEHDPAVHDFVIRDRVTGKTRNPEKYEEGQYRIVYGLITVLKNESSEKGKRGIVMFSGITSAGTQGAAEFFSSAKSLHNLRAEFRKDGLSGFPAAYQVVVRCTFSNMLLVSYEAVDRRLIER